MTSLLHYSFQFNAVFSSVGFVLFSFIQFGCSFFNALINGSILLFNNLTKDKLQQRSTVLSKITS